MMKRLTRFFITMLLIISVAVCFCGCMKDVTPPPTGNGTITDNPTDNTDDNTGDDPTDDPSDKPIDDPIDDPTGNPTDDPSDKPTDDPTGKPTDDPSDKPTDDPTDKPTDDPSDKPSGEPTHAVPQKTKTTVYYTNSNGWNNVYAYVWNYSTNAKKAAWPGEKLTSFGMSGYGEKQYRIEIDCSVYDRIIFNDGNGSQTKDLVVGGAASGYYGEDGIFTMGTDDYGKVECFNLTDTKNLNYISGSRKKITVYTPSGYTPSKRYGVIYMFDSQSLYLAADGAAATHDRRDDENRQYWAADVAVTNLVKNGGDGVIIVAVDNTDGHRDSELTMSQAFGTLTNLADNNAFYNGKLDNLGDFMRQTLMPWVKEHYSVDTSREKTGIAGSSSGGLAAYYLGLRDNDLYGYIGAFSPANGLFTSADWTRFYAGKDFSAGRPKVYVYCGKEDKNLEDMLLPATQQIKKLTSYGFKASDIIENYVKGATHNEVFWRIAFTDFLSKMAQ